MCLLGGTLLGWLGPDGCGYCLVVGAGVSSVHVGQLAQDWLSSGFSRSLAMSASRRGVMGGHRRREGAALALPNKEERREEE